ncbi:hypothetical protein CBS101457_002962 [Exobasidium rhododendri]|nr:hypothetical protein CBS101457_002962 [Exobasidium rhododendri]
MTVGYYSDANCQSLLKTVPYNAFDNSPKGCASCGPASLPTGPTMYAKVISGKSGVQLDITNNQSCPPGGAADVVATLNAGSDSCVQLEKISGGEGAASYGGGGAVLPRRSMEMERKGGAVLPRRSLERRNINCKGFKVDSQQDSSSASVRISPTIDCQNSAAPCTISKSDQHTTSVTSSYSFTAGGEVFGIKAEATFGQAYTDSQSSAVIETFSVPVNQVGYLTTYALGTLFTGTYTDCSSGGDQAGTALALKKDSVQYRLVLTNN